MIALVSFNSIHPDLSIEGANIRVLEIVTCLYLIMFVFNLFCIGFAIGLYCLLFLFGDST